MILTNQPTRYQKVYDDLPSSYEEVSVSTKKGFTDDERAAMRERAKELKSEVRKTDEKSAVLAKIAEMQEADRVLAERLHAIIKASAPTLAPKLWYGMPAYTTDGKIVCFFQSAQKFNTRYATLGFNDTANLDEGTMWPPRSERR